MLKNIQNLGMSLTKKEQLHINGGFGPTPCNSVVDCQNTFGQHSNPTNDYSCVYDGFHNHRVCVSN